MAHHTVAATLSALFILLLAAAVARAALAPLANPGSPPWLDGLALHSDAPDRSYLEFTVISNGSWAGGISAHGRTLALYGKSRAGQECMQRQLPTKGAEHGAPCCPSPHDEWARRLADTCRCPPAGRILSWQCAGPGAAPQSGPPSCGMVGRKMRACAALRCACRCPPFATAVPCMTLCFPFVSVLPVAGNADLQAPST